MKIGKMDQFHGNTSFTYVNIFLANYNQLRNDSQYLLTVQEVILIFIKKL